MDGWEVDWQTGWIGLWLIFLFCSQILLIKTDTNQSELSKGRMDPRVGSRFCRILAGRVNTGFFRFFTDYFLVPEVIMNLRILHSD